MNRRSFFQCIACAVTGVTAAVYAPGLLKDVAAPGPQVGYWFEMRFPKPWLLAASRGHYKLDWLTGASENE